MHTARHLQPHRYVQPLLKQQQKNQRAVERKSGVEDNRFKAAHEPVSYGKLFKKSARCPAQRTGFIFWIHFFTRPCLVRLPTCTLAASVSFYGATQNIADCFLKGVFENGIPISNSPV